MLEIHNYMTQTLKFEKTDAPESIQQTWKDYRQRLRDLPAWGTTNATSHGKQL